MPDDTTPPAEPASEPAPLPAEIPAESAEASTAQMPANEPLELPKIVEKPAENPTPSSPAPTTAQTARELLARANAKRKLNTEAKLEKILAALLSQDHLSNDEVQKLLKCSDATATRHLSTLVKQGKIKKEGKGRGVVYTKA